MYHNAVVSVFLCELVGVRLSAGVRCTGDFLD